MAIERRKDNKKRVLKEGEYQRANLSYEYKWCDRQGKRHSVYAPTLEALREKEQVLLKNNLDGIKSSNLTINNLYQKWLQIKRGLKDNTLSNYRWVYETYVMPDFGERKIADLKRTDVRVFYNFLVENRNLKTSTVDNIHTVMHQVLDLGVADDLIRYNPSDDALKELKKAHNDGVKKMALTVAQQNLLESYLKKSGQYQRWYPLIETLLWTGLRIGECTGLRWCDVDFDNCTISVNHTLIYYSHSTDKNCIFAINTPKTKAGFRTIPMLPRVKEALLQEREYQAEVGLTCRAVVDGYSDFIFVNRFGGVQNQSTINKAIRRIIRDCNYEVLDRAKDMDKAVTLPPFSCHTLRHTFATRMLENKTNIKVMQAILGHKDIETTLDIYADATDLFKSEEMSRFEQGFILANNTTE